MTKKLLYLLIFIFSFFLNASSSFSGTVTYTTFYSGSGGGWGKVCFTRNQIYSGIDASSCTLSEPTYGGVYTYCLGVNCGEPGCIVPEYHALSTCSENPAMGMCAKMQNSVGGCNGTPEYCSSDPVYAKVAAFLGVIGSNTSLWTYATVLGTNGVAYKCAIGSTTGTDVTIFFTYDGLKKVNPQTSNKCLSPSEYTALINTNCDLSTGWAKNSGYVTNSTTGTTTLDPAQAEAPLTPPSGSTATGPQGTPIDPSSAGTGFDSDKDGFDDVTGQPLGSSGSSGTTPAEVEIKDPEPSEIPAVPSGGEYDTEITPPEKTPLSGLFSIIDSSPFFSILSGTQIHLSGSQCLLTTANPVYGQYISFDFCDSRIVNILDYLGIAIVGLAAITAILLIFV
jgi:hypothetical protein